MIAREGTVTLDQQNDVMQQIRFPGRRKDSVDRWAAGVRIDRERQLQTRDVGPLI